ncbi:MAG: hypothetical protein NTZ83_00795 [Candidatus Pacearchaeota archaeon]|nr:hypothetical protein [Candidatus Pacearchaeota archaeon]
MDDIRGASAGFYNRIKSSSYKKYLVFTLFVLILFFLFSGGFGLFDFIGKKLSQSNEDICGDGTLYNNCSSTKPYFCLEGKLIDLASACGCPPSFAKKNNICFSSYQKDSKRIHLKYTLCGESYSLDFVVYEDFEDYISKVPRSIHYSAGSNFSRADFKLKAINEEEQRKFLMPLVIKIQNITNNKEDQARIAISIVQNIPFGASNKTLTFGGNIVNYSRYPYEVLYDMKGICGEKTDLLTFLLKEIGYGVSFFYYPEENHEAVGIKCPVKESLMESGYCFVETTGPAIITDNEISYIGIGKLSSIPEVYLIKEGKAIGENLEEYGDARKLIKIRDSVGKSGLLGPIQRKILEKIKAKYGLAEDYYG